jgi:putative membrane protein
MIQDLLIHLIYLGIALLVLALGVGVHLAITPFREVALMRQGNAAASIAFGGTVLALALPIAAVTLLGNEPVVQLVWALIAIILQLVAYVFASRLITRFRERIESGETAAAIGLSSLQLAVGLINAAALAS